MPRSDIFQRRRRICFNAVQTDQTSSLNIIPPANEENVKQQLMHGAAKFARNFSLTVSLEASPQDLKSSVTEDQPANTQQNTESEIVRLTMTKKQQYGHLYSIQIFLLIVFFQFIFAPHTTIVGLTTIPPAHCCCRRWYHKGSCSFS